MTDKQLTSLEQSTIPSDRITDKPEMPSQDFFMHRVGAIESIEAETYLSGGHARGFEIFPHEPPPIGRIKKFPSLMSYFPSHRLMTAHRGGAVRVYDEVEGREVESSGRVRLDALWIGIERHSQDDVGERNDKAGCRLRRTDGEHRHTVGEDQGQLVCRESGGASSSATELDHTTWRDGTLQRITGQTVVFPNVWELIRALDYRNCTKLLLAFSFVFPVAAAEPYPAKSVRWITPVAAGGAGDLIARSIAPRLGEIWGQQVIVDNRPGAGGTLGMGMAARGPPDGYTLVLGVSSFVVVAPGIYSKLAYDSVKDFVPITQILSGPLVLVAHPSFPPRTVAEVIRLAHSKPDAISYGSPGNGSIGHLASEMFRSMSGARMIHIPYRGSPPAYTDLLAGQIALYMGTMTAALPLIKAGRLKALATTGQVRERLLPEVPTVAESGLKNFEVMTWYGVMAPAGVPQAIIGRIHADVTRVIRQTEIREQFASEGGAVVANTPEQFGAVIERELLKWSKVAKAAGAKVD